MAKNKIKRRRVSPNRKNLALRNTPIIVKDGITLEPMIRINVGDMSDEYIKAIYDDFMEKYMSEDNISKGVRIGIFTSFCEGLGVLVYRKLVDISLVDDLMRGYIDRYWEKYWSCSSN